MSSSSSSSFSSSPFLHVVYSPHDLTRHVSTLGNNKPELRKHLILDTLQRYAKEGTHKLQFVVVEEKDVPQDLREAERVHSKGFVKFLETAFQRWTDLGWENVDMFFAGDGTRFNGDMSKFVPAQIAPRDPYQRPGESVFGQICYYAMDRLTPLYAHTAYTLRTDIGVIQRAIDIVKHSSNPATCQIYAMCTQPGHHSSANSYGGYCFINNSAVASHMLLDMYKKVAHLDVDYHAGNGTMSIFYTDPRVFFCSLHADPEIDYPYNCGFADQTGEGEGAGYTLNIPLPAHTTGAEYLTHLKGALDKIRAFGAEAMVVSLGVDTVRGDPEAAPIGSFDLDRDDYVTMGTLIRSLNVPTIWVQEGGYFMSKVPDVVTCTLVGTHSVAPATPETLEAASAASTTATTATAT